MPFDNCWYIYKEMCPRKHVPFMHTQLKATDDITPMQLGRRMRGGSSQLRCRHRNRWKLRCCHWVMMDSEALPDVAYKNNTHQEIEGTLRKVAKALNIYILWNMLNSDKHQIKDSGEGRFHNVCKNLS
jgi:hypothetical protein